MTRLRHAWALGLALTGCPREPAPAPTPSPPPLAPLPAPDAGHGSGDTMAAGELTSAQRCADCHGQIETEWEASAHAKADRSEAYRAMLAHGAGTGCARCHAPVRAVADPRDAVASEAVTCQACHSAHAASPAGAGLSLRLDDVRMYGPLCDAKDHYFHKMGCSPLHAESRFCAACHQLRERGGALPVFTAYEEWEHSPAKGQRCQACHMPGARAAVAEGENEREGVPHHGLGGRKGELASPQVALQLSTRGGCPQVQVSYTLQSRSEAHAQPGGLPGRQLVLRLKALDGAGHETGRAERVLARTLADDAGAEVPFFRATRVALDNRLGPGERRAETLTLPAACAGEVQAEVAERPLSPELARQLGLPAPQETVVTRASARFQPGREAKRP